MPDAWNVNPSCVQQPTPSTANFRMCRSDPLFFVGRAGVGYLVGPVVAWGAAGLGVELVCTELATNVDPLKSMLLARSASWRMIGSGSLSALDKRWVMITGLPQALLSVMASNWWEERSL